MNLIDVGLTPKEITDAAIAIERYAKEQHWPDDWCFLGICGKRPQRGNDSKISVGDVAKLKSGGPEMTVAGDLVGDHVRCEWFDADDQHHAQMIHVDALWKRPELR